MTIIYKIIDRDEWDAARGCGRYTGSDDDRRDGFIHFSTQDQMRETAAKHFAGRGNLILLAIDDASLGSDLKWEASRGGALFPHLYKPLPVSSVVQSWPLLLNEDGVHEFPDGQP
ncbi:MAG: DUF952 domain-containing protein [Anderseniella sp.]